MRSALIKSGLLAATAMAVTATSAPVLAADEEGTIIIVTAQRAEEDLQDVPISITVFNQEKLSNNNILTAKDIATYTPGVYAQTRFGNDVTTYTVRGFAQEQRTTATVGTYFAEVVAPRGNGVSQGGDGASPGALFDLENVQVLKGPQGTLFGRNTTGGAVLLVPVKPKDEFEAYVEGTVGNLNRWRAQGVLNLPISETFRVRLGVDRQKRDGYIKNIGFAAKHDEDMGSIDIIALRGSAVWDIAPNVENYTIVTYSESKSSGAIPKIITAFPTNPVLGGGAAAQVARENAAGDFWTASNANPNGESYNEEFRVINRTTWDINDNITLTNIFGYSRYKANTAVMAFGVFVPLVAPGTAVTSPGQVLPFVPISANPDHGLTADQEAIVEELRLNGVSGRLTWQVGAYYEKNSPKSFTGTFSPAFAPCVDITRFMCAPGRSGSISSNKVWSKSIAIYGQATYEISDSWSVTGGIRWTEDKTRANFMNGRVFFGATPATNTFACGFGGLPDSGIIFPNTQQVRSSRCFTSDSTKTSAPTWLINVQYRPNNDIMLYAKYARGYRQGSIVPPAPTGLQSYDEEQVDLFEVGAKTSWNGPIRGTFNVAAYYNDFKDQQLQLGITCTDGTCLTTTILNAGSSELYGIEADLMIEPAEWVRLEAAYSYNKTKIKAITIPNLGPAFEVRPLAAGGPIPLAVPHAFNATLTFDLPIPESMGDLSISGTIVHQSSFRAVADAIPGSNAGILPKRTFGNANLTWKNLGGGPVDAILYVTNITNEKMLTHINDQSTRGFISASIDEPRQYGIRVKYRFGRLAN